ncbi:MAG: dTDP-glucose 4,6-dehydratase [Candidatus Marinimicrobia bacterium]|nr:dTDP-glucose 4,6-dehydratase [Candidatus Neomarinimicrobiota bacterium]|tara:strand:+ start:14240 stop:15289 length:1050 start_codon:yes stop_codon:yes gene_type:complete
MRKLKNILVTGGSGFIGSNFIRLILDKSSCIPSIEKVINIDKLTYAGNLENNQLYKDDSRYFFVKDDICNKNIVTNLISNFNIDAIVNFAAESHVDNSIEKPGEFIQTNIVGTYNLLECVRNKKLSGINPIFLHVSTDEVYGTLSADDEKFNEFSRYKPNSPYSASKAASDHLIRAWNKTFGLKTLITNCSNNYGPNQNEEKLIPKTISRAILKKSIDIYGEGKNIRDWLYVEDHCNAIVQVLTKGKIGETYNIGGLNEISNIEIVNMICEKLEDIYPFRENTSSMDKEIKVPTNSYKDLIRFVADRPGHDFRYSINPEKIQNELDWIPSVEFELGIEKTVNWYIKKLT